MAERLEKVPLWYKGASLITVASLAACQLGKKLGYVTPPPEGTQTPPTETVPPTETPTPFVEPGRILDLEKDQGLLSPEIKKEFEDFDALHPELEGRDVYKFTIQSPIGQIGFATHEVKPEEIETAIIAQSEDGKTAISIPDRALYVTAKDAVSGKYSWSRLLGIATPGASENTKIVSWFYLPEGYPKAEETTLLNLDYPVLAYQMPNNGELLFWYPVMVGGKPTWSSDYQMAVVSRYESLPEGARKVLFSLLPVEPTPTPEAVFVPEGFQIGELGLLQNPETGKNVLAMNPEADWQRVREEIIGGLWQANIDWDKFTGESSDALNYSKEAFIKAALEGKILKIGIPVRDNITLEKIVRAKENGNLIEGPHDDYNVLFIKYGGSLVRLKLVEVRLNNIQVQVVAVSSFKHLMGEKEWLDLGNEALSQTLTPNDKGNGAIHFGINEEKNLIITTGNYYTGDQPVGGMQLTMGNFNPAFHDKYPTYFREDGLGVNVDKAASFYTACIVDWLKQLPAGEKDIGGGFKDGRRLRYILLPLALPAVGAGSLDTSGWYVNPSIFVFTK